LDVASAPDKVPSSYALCEVKMSRFELLGGGGVIKDDASEKNLESEELNQGREFRFSRNSEA